MMWTACATEIGSVSVMQTPVDACCEQILAPASRYTDRRVGNPPAIAPGGPRGDTGPRAALVDFRLAKALPSAFRRAVLSLAAAPLAADAAAVA